MVSVEPLARDNDIFVAFCCVLQNIVKLISSLYVCMVNIKLKYNFVETPRKFIFAKLSIRKLGFSSVLITCIVISTDEGPSLRIESFAKINLRGVSTKLYFNCETSFVYLCGKFN